MSKGKKPKNCVITITIEEHENGVKTRCSINGAINGNIALYSILALTDAIANLVEGKDGKCQESGNK